MAASIAMMTPQQMGAGGGAGGGGAFSPLTLFECTITNATMLIDSMAAARDLMGLPTRPMLTPDVRRLRLRRRRILDHLDREIGNSAMKMQQQPSSSGAVADFMSAGSLKREYNSDDDCQILDDDASGSMFGSFDIVGAPGGSGAAFGASAGSPAKIARTSGGDLSDTGELSAEWKGILRKAYRQLKDETGSNVFDFSLPYSAPVNMEAAKKVIDKALQITSYKPTNIAAWTKANNFYLRTVVYKNMRRKFLEEERVTTLNSYIASARHTLVVSI
uniref:Ras-GEF domain-containing protein n=1 Tax=Macrostomum lignano TaxID=282301 RepID=A0A1I8FQ20_9PLAT